ncbi:ATP-binding cassette domain-containing protein [Pyrodictium occultum]|nr:ATP-binding cassette domain-containing protein [Pyrodictium occultum]
MLEAQVRRVTYPGGRVAVENVHVSLEPGEVLLVVGPSGSGKSTLLKTIAGVIPFIEDAHLHGSILVHGESIEGLPPGRRPVAYMPQDPSELALGDYGAEILLLYGAKPRLEVEELLERRVSEMSSGQLQRLLLSAVLGQGRSIVLLDEPLANLDVYSSSLAYRTVKEVAGEGGSVIVAEHRVSKLAGLADKILVLGKDGRPVYYGKNVEGGLRIAEDIGVRPADATGEQVEIDVSCKSVSGWKDAVAGLENVYAGYEGRAVLKGLSFICPRGAMVAVIGPNGSGKTTMLRLLAGVAKPWRGRVYYAWGRWDWRMIGYAPASPWLSFLEDTVFDEVAVAARRAGSSSFREDALEVLKLLGLQEYLGEKPWRLSGGEMVRLAVARAVVKKPRLLLLDEPLRGQDRRSAEVVLEAARLVARSGGCSVVVTHDLEFLREFDLIYRVDRGCYMVG